MLLQKNVSINPVQQNGKVYLKLSEVGEYFGYQSQVLRMFLRKAANKTMAAPDSIHVTRQKAIFATIDLIREMLSSTGEATGFSEFSSENISRFCNVFYEMEDKFKQGVLFIPQATQVDTKNHNIRSKKRKINGRQVVSSIQIAADFSVAPSEIYACMKDMIANFGLKQNEDFFYTKDEENGYQVFNGVRYRSPYFTHTGLLAIAMKLKARNEYNFQWITHGMLRCMERRFVYEADNNSTFVYDDYMTMFVRQYKKEVQKAELSMQDEIDLKDLLERFRKLH